MTKIEYQQPHIWFTVEIRLTQPQVELALGLSLAVLINTICLDHETERKVNQAENIREQAFRNKRSKE